MLLFIAAGLKSSSGVRSFQYISCCYLSKKKENQKSDSCVSIHLMLLFIQALYHLNHILISVSIHLMLLFIHQNLWVSKGCGKVSIHLMLLFIKIHERKSGSCNLVSIHLMLLFIPLRPCQDVLS